ncbi:MAG: serine/threonine protein kinase [Bdellovibrionaceae bacterium]|nr:serine/threonine protein kinase [Pseudobdellovibrionaceae bacterium]
MRWKRNHIKILELLGEGLTSRVYKAIRKHQKLGVEQVVALKILRSTDQVSSLKNEMELLLTVDSPFCVKMLGWEETSKGLALVLEFLDGVSLQELQQFNTLTTDETDEIILQIQEGLKELHAKQVVHGDLNLKNIFVTNKGTIKILDFGFSSNTQKIFEYGTPQFMSLEAWDGCLLTPQSDLFSLGLIQDYLKSGLCDSYINKGSWKQRAVSLKNTNSLLLENPTQRHFVKGTLSAEKQIKIAQKVREAQTYFKEAHATTRLHCLQPVRVNIPRKTHSVVSIVCSLFASVVVSASEPHSHNEFGQYFDLDVRSAVWAQGQLYRNINGVEYLYGDHYLPSKVRSLPAGEFVLYWTSAQKSGRMRLRLHKNERLILPTR